MKHRVPASKQMGEVKVRMERQGWTQEEDADFTYKRATGRPREAMIRKGTTRTRLRETHSGSYQEC